MSFLKILCSFMTKRAWLSMIMLLHFTHFGAITQLYVRTTQTQVNVEAASSHEVLNNAGAMACAPLDKLGMDSKEWTPGKIFASTPGPKHLIKSCKLHDPEGYGMAKCRPYMFEVRRFLTQQSICYVFDNLVKYRTFKIRHVYHGGSSPILWSVTLSEAFNKLLQGAEGKSVRFELYLFASGSKFQSVSGPSTTHDLGLGKTINFVTGKSEDTVKRGSFALTYQPTMFKRLESPKEPSCKNYLETTGNESQEECLHDCLQKDITGHQELTGGKRLPLLFRLTDTDMAYDSRIYDDELYDDQQVRKSLDAVFSKCEKGKCEAKDCYEERFPVKVMTSSDSEKIVIEVRAANAPITEVTTEPKMSTVQYISETANTFSFWWGLSPREILRDYFPWLKVCFGILTLFCGISEATRYLTPPPGAEGSSPNRAPDEDVEAGQQLEEAGAEPVAGPSGGLQPSGFIHTTFGTNIDHVELQCRQNSKNIIATVDEVKKLKSGLNQLRLELPSKRMRIRNEVKKSLLDLSDGANDNFKTLSDAVQKLGQKWREMRAKADKHEQSILVLVGQSHQLAEKATVKKLEASLQSLTEKVGIDSDGTQLLIKAHLDRIEKLEQSSSQQSRDNGRLEYLEELMLQSIQDSGRIFHLEQKLEQSSAQFSQLKQQSSRDRILVDQLKQQLEQASSQSTRDQLRFQQLEQQSTRDRLRMDQLDQKLEHMSRQTESSNILVEPAERPNSSPSIGDVEQFEMSAGVDMHTPPPVA